jgi:hypothetical protein
MENKNKIPVYFHFYDLVEEMDHRLLLTCSDDEWKDWEEEDIQVAESFIGKMEIEYGIHDVMDSYKDEYILVGYCSAELKKDKTNEFLKKWRKKMYDKGWTKPGEQFQSLKITQDEI